MFFKHYPGSFIPLDRGTPSVFQLPSKHPAWECWLVQCQHCQKKKYMRHTWEKPLYENELQKKKEKTLHQHDNNSSTLLLRVVPCPLTFSLTHFLHKDSYRLNMFFFFLHYTWLGHTLTKHHKKFQFGSKANLRCIHCELPTEDKLLKWLIALSLVIKI